jgi:hypothetical protein
MADQPNDDTLDPLVRLVLMLGNALFAAVIVGVLYLSAMATIGAYRAVHGEAGVPGTVTVEGFVGGNHGGSRCEGMFAPDDGGLEERVMVEIGKSCTAGERVDARLMKSGVPIIGAHLMSTAWAEDSHAWIARAVLLVVVAIVAVPYALVFGLSAIGMHMGSLLDLARSASRFLRH